MNGIEKITAKIAADTEAEIAQLTAQTDEKVQSIGKAAQAQADKETADTLARGRKAADERLERLKSAAQMETRKLALGAKQEVLGEAFDLALEKLCTLPDGEYIELLTRLAVEASSTGREQLVFSPKDRARIGKQVVVAANDTLVKGVAPELPNSITDTKVGALLGKVVNSTAAIVTGTGMLTLSEETRPIKGGFIMVDGDVEINCAFETLVRLQREKLEKDVANLLFN
ncbi:V-type ATP synthase subunit E [Pseudoflavonifractor phocaeensis]|uniref:V-type ATP synthase subunit E n=1 Tax=Pseudoflavonifractor phocaeensis TaxID=1870988 RepID=UPI001F1FF074|nr:V-type ATP synthase subunit E [Pseudoflavonifractor phocaeensis]MCF2661656.1 V-type ATP synthase subunit E [Pseudoflavonifractor phocaeensis]